MESKKHFRCKNKWSGDLWVTGRLTRLLAMQGLLAIQATYSRATNKHAYLTSRWLGSHETAYLFRANFYTTASLGRETYWCQARKLPTNCTIFSRKGQSRTGSDTTRTQHLIRNTACTKATIRGTYPRWLRTTREPRNKRKANWG